MPKTQLASLEIHYLIKELQFLIGSKIDKIYNPSKKELLIQLHAPGKGKQQLKIAPNAIYLTEHKQNASEPTEFCMFLRKHLDNTRIASITQLGFERIVSIELQAKESKYNLIAELFSTGNILLTQNNKILIAAEYQNWKDRTIRPKEIYTYPKKEFNFLEFIDIKKFLKTTDKSSIVKALAIDLGLGGVYAEEACSLSKLDKNKKPSELAETETKSILNALNSLKTKKISPLAIYKGNEIIDIIPFSLSLYKDVKQVSYNSYSLALDFYFSQATDLLENAKHTKQLDKIKELLESQKQHIEELKKEELENRHKAELLYSHYETITSILNELKEISKKHSWQEIKEKLKSHKLIKEVIPNEKSVVIEL